MNDAFYKPSLNVGSFIGENSSVDTERFLLFMQAYYEWMQSTELTLTSKTGTFQVGETIVGSISGATATIKEVKTNSIVIKLTTRTAFNYGEIVDGQTSNATGTINTIKDNVGRASGNVLNYKTLETSVDKYVDYLREELYPSIPASYYGDKRLVAQYFKDFYESKSNEQSYRFLFKLLYNEDIEFYYPGTDVLRVSDGNFEKTQIIRTIATATGIDSLGNPYDRDIFLFLNKTIRGETSGFLANVVDIKKFFIGSREVAEMTLKLVSGTFTAGEDIVDIADDNLVTTIYGIVSGVTIVDGGSGYEEGDNITISGDGSEAQARVSSIKESPISALKVNSTGHGYQLNTAATIDNTGTGGSGLIVRVTELANTYTVTSGSNTYIAGEISKVSIINRGEGYFKKPSITLQDTTISSLGLLSDKLITINNAGSNYGVGNTLVFTGGSGANAAGQIASVVETTTYDLLFEDGQQMLMDGSYDDIIKNEDWAVLGPIKRIELTNFGSGYSSANLPSITISTTTGSSANLIATNVQGKSANVTVDTSNNITGIGSIRAVEIVNFGINYSTATADASIIGDGNANLVPVITGLGIREGVWLDDDGKIDYKIIQDSYYYQDYSYVIKSGLTFQTYSDTLKGIIHPAGLTYFGEIQILNDIDVTSVLVNAEAIQRVLVQMLTYLTVGGQYEYSNISWTVKVEAPVVNLSTDLLDVQEYVIHLVPEGDEETGITDVGVVINGENARHSFIIQTPFELDVTATSATLPTTKFVVSKFDIVPGYGQNTYGNLSLTPLGVYGDDWAGTPISVLQDVKFSDLYYENPAYQSILNLYIDNTIDVGVYNTITRLNYETFAVSGTIPLVQSIVTTESLTIKPEIPIALTLNDVGVSMSTEMQRELPVLIAETSTLNVAKEYKLTGHGTRRTKYGSIVLEDYQSVLISAVENITFDDFIVSSSMFADMHVEADIISSSVAPQKFASAQNVTALYNIILDDIVISQIANQIFTDLLPESVYQGTSTTYETSTFGSSYTTYPLTYHEYVKQVPIIISGTSTLEVAKEYKVGRHAITLKRWNEVLLSEFETTSISTIADNAIGGYTVRPEDLADMHVDISIPYSSVLPSKGATGNIVSLYDVRLSDTTIAEVGSNAFTDLIPQSAYEGTATTFETTTIETLGFRYPRTFQEYIKYVPVINTELNNLSTNREIVVRAEGHGFKYALYNDALVSDYSSTSVSALSDIRFDAILGEVYDATIKMSPSPYAGGQAAVPTSTDIFRNEITFDIESSTDGHSIPYGQIPIDAIADLSLSGTFYDKPLSDETFNAIYPTIYTKTDYTKYVKISGTVSSANAGFSTLPVSTFSSTPIDYFDNSLLSELAPVVVGSGTDFVADFSLGNAFVANNEYFKVESIANTTYMISDRLPASTFTNVFAYKHSV